jgi:hypothetical protein
MCHHSGWTKTAAGLAFSFFISSCDATSYKEPVSSFATGTTAAQSALIEINRQATSGVADIYRDQAVKGQAFLGHKDGDCTVNAQRCRLTVTIRSQEREVPPESPLRNTIALMGRVAVYAQGLDAIVTANTAEEVASSVNSALGSAQDLAELVAKLQGQAPGSATVPEFATPVGEAVNWVLGTYIEHVKLDGLRRATHDANPIIKEAAKVAGAEAGIAGDIQRRGFADTVTARFQAFDESKSAASYDELVAAATAYDNFLTSAPSDVFQKMATAHEALTNSLNDKNLSLADAMAKIKSFQTQAETLWRIAKDLAAIGAKKEEPK